MNDKKFSTWFIRTGFFAIVILIILAVLYSLDLLFMPMLVSLLLTFLLQPVVLFFENRGFNRIVILVGIYITVTLAAAATLYLLFPVITNEAKIIAQNLPHYESMIRKTLLSIQLMIQEKFPSAQIPDLYEYGKSFLFKKQDSGVDQFGVWAGKAASVA